MIKVHDKALEGRIKGILKESKSKKPEAEIVELLRSLQDAGGLKICQNVSTTDVAYREV